MHPAKWFIIYRLLWNYLPAPLLKLVKYTPTREYRRLRTTTGTFTRIAAQLLDEKRRQGTKPEEAPRPRDVLSILGEQLEAYPRSRTFILFVLQKKRTNPKILKLGSTT